MQPDDLAFMDHVGFTPDGFSGVVPVFPLTGVFLYPRILLPLHIFEDRYRAMVRDALDGEKLVAMAVPRPGTEEPDPGTAPLLETACVGRILDHAELPGGRFDILLIGVARVRLEVEADDALPYRRFRAEILSDRREKPPARLAARTEALLRLTRALPDGVLRYPNAPAALEQLDPSLGPMTDLLSDCLDLDARTKRALLAELSVTRRADRLVEGVRRAALELEGTRPRPRFSSN